MTILINTFHGTEYNTRLSQKQLDDIEYRANCGTITDNEAHTVCRIRRALCGVRGCYCGGYYGERA